MCQVFGWDWLSGSGEVDGNVKSLRQRRQRRRRRHRGKRQGRRTTDRFWSEKLTLAHGSGELKTQDPPFEQSRISWTKECVVLS